MTDPTEQWWTINGAELMDALHRSHNGDTPDVVYLELLANSDNTHPAEEGRHLANERDTLIAGGVDPSDLIAPIHPTDLRVHNHPPYRPTCNERRVGQFLRGDCLNDDGTSRGADRD